MDCCPACETSQFETSEGIPVPTCSGCGLVISEEVDSPPEPDDTDDSSPNQPTWSEIYAITNETEKQVAEALDCLIDVSEELSLSADTILAGTELVADAAVRRLADGRSWELIVAAAACLGARSEGEPRPTRIIANTVDVEPNRLRHGVRLLQRELNHEYTQACPTDYLPYLCNTLSLTEDVEDRSRDLLAACDGRFVTEGTAPVGVAGAVVYVAADGRTTQRAVADAAGVTQETIRVRLSDLRNMSVTGDD